MATAQEATITEIAPPIFQDEELTFTPSASINKRLTRYIWFAGDVIASRRKFDFKQGDRDAGGEELASRCLWRVRGYLRRGRITPVEVGPEWHTKEEISETQVQDALNNGRITASPKTGLPEFYGEDVLPGDEIASIIAADDSMSGYSKGIVELTPLIGREWKNDPQLGSDPEIFALQRFFFPDYPKLPVTLREIQELINRAGDERMGFRGWSATEIETIASQKNDSCTYFRDWGSQYVEMENQRLAARVGVGGFVHRYSDVAQVIMKQLEIKPLTINQLEEKATQLTTQIDKETIAQVAAAAAGEVIKGFAPSKGLSMDDLKQLIADNPEEMKALFAAVVPKPRIGRPPKVTEA